MKSNIPKDFQFQQAWSAYGLIAFFGQISVSVTFGSYVANTLFLFLLVFLVLRVSYFKDGLLLAGYRYIIYAILCSFLVYISSVINISSEVFNSSTDVDPVGFLGLLLLVFSLFTSMHCVSSGASIVIKKFNIDELESEKWYIDQMTGGNSKKEE